ncbi:TerB family tellurite resistance protein [Candidatus Dependentiae bacterium]|nr:TerB family tellurite resistance protein [Candidatus Dependentiae bacterium]
MIGKLLGGGIGFILGGPIGALLGVGIGHVIDADNINIRSYSGKFIRCNKCGNLLEYGREVCDNCGNGVYGNDKGYFQEQNDYQTNQVKQSAFITVLIALCAKMAQADGKVDAAEVRIVKDFFKTQLNLDEDSLQKIRIIFKEALNSNHNIDDLLLQWKTISNPQINIEILNLLYKIAMSDGSLHKGEEEFINKVVMMLGISETHHHQIKSLYISATDQYYEILGISGSATDQEIKKAYRTLVTQYHPDKLVSKGLPEDMIKFATEKMNKINEAYEEIRKKRKI